MGYIAFRKIFLFLNVYLDYYMVSGNYCLSLKRVCETVFSCYLRDNSEGFSPPPKDV